MQGLPALRRSSFASALLALLGAGGLLYSTACFSAMISSNSNADSGNRIAAGVLDAGLIAGITWPVWHLFLKQASTPPCRDLEGEAPKTIAEWRGLADCQQMKGQHEQAAHSRAVAEDLAATARRRREGLPGNAQLLRDAQRPAPCLKLKAQYPSSITEWRLLADCQEAEGHDNLAAHSRAVAAELEAAALRRNAEPGP
jgi:hypothetical protein